MKQDIIEEMLSQYDEMSDTEKSNRENMIRFYMSKMGVTTEEAITVIDGLLLGRTKFLEELSEVKKRKDNVKELFTERLTAYMATLPKEQQFENLRELLHMLQKMSLTQIGKASEEEELQCKKECENLYYDMHNLNEDEITDELIAQMIADVGEGVNCCTTVNMVEIMEALANPEDAQERMQRFFEVVKDGSSVEQLAQHEMSKEQKIDVYLLIGYICYCNGAFTEIPRDLTPEQASIVLSGAYETADVMEDVVKGKTTWEKAIDILQRILVAVAGAIVITMAGTIILIPILLATLASNFVGVIFFLAIAILLFRGVKVSWKGIKDVLKDLAGFVTMPIELVKLALTGISIWIKNSIQRVKEKIEENKQTKENEQVVTE